MAGEWGDDEVESWTAQDAARALRMPTDVDDKYSRGVVGLRTGSEAFPGAAVLGVEAAWRAGAGMVRYLGPERPRDLVLQRRPETVTADGRVQAWVIGSGTSAADRSADETTALRALLAGDVPVVVDAGALDLAAGARAPLVVTPHAGEFARLREQLGLAPVDLKDSRTDAAAAVAETSAGLGGAVLLKGARTLVATPEGQVRAVSEGTPWLAAAGTGDVLAGVLGALVAARAADGGVTLDALAELAATAAWLHGAAARVAAGQSSPGETASGAAPDGPGRPIVALEVALALPVVLGALLALR
ncbi:MAG: ADP/ATP-dependent (S)-NAD(P)H-hydrate dehydratase [Microbacterium sp.]